MDRSDIWGRFLETLSYSLYPYQEEALLAWFEASGGVMVCAPTGMGKTLIAEAAVFEALHTGKRLYYTTPLIALTDQKFRELADLAEKWGFSRESVGLITGNRRVNPDAPIRVVVAEILLNHLIAHDPAVADFAHVDSLVMDEFHNFNDIERGIVWELALVLLPRHVRVLLLSATVGNPLDFCLWLKKEHGRELVLITSNDRRVPLEFNWVGDLLLTDLLPAMCDGPEEQTRVPALVFCFNRDECWDLAEKLKGLSLTSASARKEIEAYLDERKDDLAQGVGPKLRQMLLRGVGVHHAGVLPRHKEIVETLFSRKLAPIVVCTETLSAGINLPARSVVLSSLIKGPRGKKLPIPSSVAHQIFGRAGRPQFDSRGFVYAVAHEDDVRIAKWKKKYEQIDQRSKDPGVLRALRDLERKRPTRRKTEQYWSEGQFKALIAAGPAKLYSRSMIPYQVLIYLLLRTGVLHDVRSFLARRFASAADVEKFQAQLNFMIGNLAGLGYLQQSEDGDHVSLNESIRNLAIFRSVDPLYAAYLCEMLARASEVEKTLALESVLSIPPALVRRVPIPTETQPGPLQRDVLDPLMIQMGVVAAKIDRGSTDDSIEDEEDVSDLDESHPPSFPEMLKIVFEARLPNPEPVAVQPKWIAAGVFEMGCEFFPFVKARELVKQEGLILRHMLRLAILSGELRQFTQDPDYERIAELATRACRGVDPTYTDRYLEQAQRAAQLAPAM